MRGLKSIRTSSFLGFRVSDEFSEWVSGIGTVGGLRVRLPMILDMSLPPREPPREWRRRGGTAERRLFQREELSSKGGNEMMESVWADILSALGLGAMVCAPPIVEREVPSIMSVQVNSSSKSLAFGGERVLFASVGRIPMAFQKAFTAI